MGNPSHGGERPSRPNRDRILMMMACDTPINRIVAVLDDPKPIFIDMSTLQLDAQDQEWVTAEIHHHHRIAPPQAPDWKGILKTMEGPT
ncbi:unnamed protein product [Phytomonas sp. Hart1]|nr:unnamed protein product [Phytomonas sp. Hart1]|eukprot:CCW68105.1 unnamed protein product [Phytomonas sp. isolate Hart1]